MIQWRLGQLPHFLAISGIAAFGLLLSSGNHSMAADSFEDSATTLVQTDRFIARRNHRYFVVSLLQPHQVLSTSRVNGGDNDRIRFLVNHQSMEARADQQQMMNVLSRTPQQYHQIIADNLQLAAPQMVLMGTAANMHNLAHNQQRFMNLTVDAFVTAGVTGNALRAGDPASWYETDHGNAQVDYQGTINTILLINRPLTAGARAKAAMIMVEAKSAALTELAVASKVSPHMATGTGTDQFTIASPDNPAMKPLQSASGHLKIGELIGTAVRQATLESLRWQNRLLPSAGTSVFHALERFGLTEAMLKAQLEKQLPAAQLALAKKNFRALANDPRLVAAAYAYAALLDRQQYQMLPTGILPEALRDQATQAAVAVSGQVQQWPGFRQQLEPPAKLAQPDEAIALFTKAMAIGWLAKWDFVDSPQ